tara:strand:+ start:44698 stop:44895 length:198 start_codon:yes stop_codon:yes gene_type:complete
VKPERFILLYVNQAFPKGRTLFFLHQGIFEITAGCGSESGFSETEWKMIQFVRCFHYKKRWMCVK